MEGLIMYVILFIVGFLAGGALMFMAAKKTIQEAPVAPASNNSCSNVVTTVDVVQPKVTCTTEQIKNFLTINGYQPTTKSQCVQMCRSDTPLHCPKDCTKCCTQMEYDDQVRQIRDEMTATPQKQKIPKLTGLTNPLSGLTDTLTSVTDGIKYIGIS